MSKGFAFFVVVVCLFVCFLIHLVNVNFDDFIPKRDPLLILILVDT